jgi:methyltransferase family protein
MVSRWEWEALSNLPEAVRRGGTVTPQHAETLGYAYWEDFAAHASAVAAPTADLMAEVLSPWAARQDRLHVLDMACGHGLYGYTLALRQQHAQVWSLDWPNVLPLALDRAARMGVGDRVSTIAGDMFEVGLGGPYDVVMITNVGEVHSARACERMLSEAGFTDIEIHPVPTLPLRVIVARSAAGSPAAELVESPRGVVAEPGHTRRQG